MKLSEHFSRSEFECSCGCGFDTVDAALLEALEALRDACASPVTILSGCRCPAHNNSIGGARKSQHLYGRAADVHIESVPPAKVADVAEALGLSVGRYDTFTHMDTRSGPPIHWNN